MKKNKKISKKKTKKKQSKHHLFDFGQLISSANFDFGQFRRRPIRFRPIRFRPTGRNRIGRSRPSSVWASSNLFFLWEGSSNLLCVCVGGEEGGASSNLLLVGGVASPLFVGCVWPQIFLSRSCSNNPGHTSLNRNCFSRQIAACFCHPMRRDLPTMENRSQLSPMHQRDNPTCCGAIGQ